MELMFAAEWVLEKKLDIADQKIEYEYASLLSLYCFVRGCG